MNKDFRVLVTLPTHPKTKKLMRQLGDRSFYNLIRLWAWVAQNKPEGELSNMDKDDIEIAADWQGDEGLFVDTLIDLRLIDCENETCIIHDWTENNGYASAAKVRSEKARKAAMARWGAEDKNAKQCSEQCSDMLEHDLAYAPSPSPSPSPSPNKYPFKYEKKVPIPKNFCLTDDMQAYAERRRYIGNDLEGWTEEMILSAKAKGYKYQDWHATWKKWFGKHLKDHPELVEVEKDWRA